MMPKRMMLEPRHQNVIEGNRIRAAYRQRPPSSTYQVARFRTPHSVTKSWQLLRQNLAEAVPDPPPDCGDAWLQAGELGVIPGQPRSTGPVWLSTRKL
jgi:hypothetical protein